MSTHSPLTHSLTHSLTHLGDEQTKKLIGEAMMKSRSGEKMEAPKI
jgi:hypothetical protein